MKIVEPVTTTSSVVTSLRVLAELEDERIAREREALLEVARASKAAEAQRQQEDAERRRRAEDERIAVTTAAIERVRLDHRAAQERDAEARRVANERLRQASEALATRAPRRSSRPGATLRVAHGVATVILAVAVLLCLFELRTAHRAHAALAGTVVADQRALDEARAENAELTRDYRIALDAARNASPRPDPPAPPPPPLATPPQPAPSHPHAPPLPPPHIPPRPGCNPHDPLCADP